MTNNKLGFWVLTALVVGNMVGSGIFMLPRSLAEVASPAGVTLAWLLTGAGVLMLTLVFGNLAVRKPELNGGPQMYAKALFREGTEASKISGFLTAWGYWVANFAGNVAIITTFASYLSTFFPIMTSAAPLFTVGPVTIKVGNMITFLVCTALLWVMHTLILRGIEGAGKVNALATAAKILGFLVFIMLSLLVFQKSNLLPFVAPRLDEAGVELGLLSQVNNAAIATLWAFVGVESAVVFSSRAKKQSDVKRATIFGLLLALGIYIGITVLVMGALTQEQLIAAEKPLVDALMIAVGPSGSYLMAGLGLVALTGTTMGWILLSAEVSYQAARQGLFPKVFLKENKTGAPVMALVITNLCSQLFIFSTISESIAGAFDFVIVVATLSYLTPYIAAAVYQLKLVVTGETYAGQGSSRFVDGVIAALATGYSLWVIKAGTGDMKTFSLGIGMIVVGILFYPAVKKNEGRVDGSVSGGLKG